MSMDNCRQFLNKFSPQTMHKTSKIKEFYRSDSKSNMPIKKIASTLIQ